MQYKQSHHHAAACGAVSPPSLLRGLEKICNRPDGVATSSVTMNQCAYVYGIETHFRLGIGIQ